MVNAPRDDISRDPLCAYSFALAALARLALPCTTLDESVRARLEELGRPYENSRRLVLRAFRDYLRTSNGADRLLIGVARQFDLTPTEILAVRLAAAAEEDVVTGHVLTHLQQPVALSRPTIGLLAEAYGDERGPNAVHVLAQGQAVRCGLLRVSDDELPLPERHVRLPLALSLALQGMAAEWPGTSATWQRAFSVPLGVTADKKAAALSERLRASNFCGAALVIRSGDVAEARAAAEAVCLGLGKKPVLIHTDQLAGMAPWLFLNGFIPIFTHWLAPGERKPVPTIAHHAQPLVVLTGPDGDFESDERSIVEWRLETPAAAEREHLWSALIDDRSLARRVAHEHRHTAGRIAALAAKVSEAVGSGNSASYEDIRGVARRGESTGLGALAEIIPDEVDDAALVVPAALRDELESLVVRCRLREQFFATLGPAIRARYRPSVRALFVGPSGTGKTLAAAWLASRLGMPLCRVDLSAITSKYIGETEKNLSQLLARAELNEVVLLFDEADSLFGKRTDIQDANDRFANAQTNYLLQRMETYDGITVLTSNGRSRFDAAFTRRFDAILTFPAPGAEERRELWSAHLGTTHAVSVAQLNLLSAIAELSGGQIRNAVLRGAVAAAMDGGTISYDHVLTGVTSEYRKVSRQLPSDLKLANSIESG